MLKYFEINKSLMCSEFVSLLAQLRQPEGPPSGAPYPYREIKESHGLIFSCYGGQQYVSWARTHDDGQGGGP